jgi:dolichyl-phosphate-mannose-protein mannosyltransferase
MPLMAQRHTFHGYEDVKDVASDLVQEQRNVWGYHANLRATHPYFVSWTTWPWLKRPTWYYYKQDQDGEHGYVHGIVAIGNPALWWVSLPVSVFVLGWGLWRREPWRIFSGLGYFMLYLPWGVSPRQLNYSHYLFEAIPYACLSLAFLLDRYWDSRARWVPRAYVGLIVLLFLFFFPFLTALPVPTRWFFESLWNNGPRPWTWFPTWV